MKLGWLACLVVAIGGTGCGDATADGGEVAPMDDDFPAGGCRGTGGTAMATDGCDTEAAATEAVADTTGVSNACSATNDCPGGRCVAPWDPNTESRGEFECAFACIPNLDDRQWCADDAACCDGQARCTARGYCIVEESDETGRPATGTSGGTSSGGDTDATGSGGSTAGTGSSGGA